MSGGDFSWMGFVRRSVSHSMETYGFRTASDAGPDVNGPDAPPPAGGIDPKTTSKVRKIATVFLALLMVLAFVSSKKLNPFKVIKLFMYSGELIAIFACRHFNIISLRTTVILNGVAFLNYYA